MLAHAAEMDVEPALVIAERLVARPVPLDPAADVLAQREVVRGRAEELVGERAEEAVPVAERRRRVEAQRAQLLGELLAVLGRVGDGLGGGGALDAGACVGRRGTDAPFPCSWSCANALRARTSG